VLLSIVKLFIDEILSINIRNDLGERRHLRGADLGFVEPQLADGCLFGRAGVEGHVADAQVVVLEDLESPLFLNAVMLALRAPADDRLLVPPG
jgi:hypothetical protein